MTFTEAVKTCFTKYCCFEGRARRREYWFFCLFNFIVSFVALAIAGNSGSTALPTLVSLGLLLPGLGVSVRRMHDVGKSGWYLLMSLIPIAGAIIVLVKLCEDSQPGTNQYGPNPKESFADRGFSAPIYSEPAPTYSEPAPTYSEPAPTYSEPTGLKFCPNCGAIVGQNSPYCSNCGAKL